MKFFSHMTGFAFQILCSAPPGAGDPTQGLVGVGRRDVTLALTHLSLQPLNCPFCVSFLLK